MQKQGFLYSESFLISLICCFSLCYLLYAVSTLSISYYEAEIFYNSGSMAGVISRFFVSIFGQNDYALRSPFLISHVISIVLLYKISKSILKRKFDRVVSVLIFIFLPGVIASAILVNDAGIVIMLALLGIYLYQIRQTVAFYLVLVLLAFASDSFLAYFIALFVFGIYKKDGQLAWLSAILFSICLSIYGFDTGGKPRGYFLDTISIFAAVFSPFVFIYFVYCMYRIWVKEQKNLLWFVVITSFCLCLVASIRQRLEIENFLPFCVISTPLIVRVFFNSYRVRLPIFRKSYKFMTSFVAFSLIASFVFVLFNEIFYIYAKNPKKHFAYKYHIAKELSIKLKEMDIKNVQADERLALRLKFYGIENGKTKLINLDLKDNYANITIEKFGKPIAKFKLSQEYI
ncbi:glycosyltransferase family 39 protein [Campylobacter sp. RM16189]|uniref:glycosyltransferase family 39 protein n=1 Tax=Campylobacter sp. RM16189 TaxID=1705726 RepID=UPI001476217F